MPSIIRPPFQSANSLQLLQSNRRGQSQSALRAVQGRHEAIQKIEKQMVELAQLFQDVDAAIVEQEAPIMQIEDKMERTEQNVSGGNKNLDGAIKKARSIRKKKWICLGLGSKLSVSRHIQPDPESSDPDEQFSSS